MTTSYLFHWTQLVVFCVQDSEKYQASKISTNNLLNWMLSISLKTTDLWFLWDSPTKYSLSIIKTSWISWIKLKILIEYWINIINSNNEIEFYLNWANMNHHSSDIPTWSRLSKNSNWLFYCWEEKMTTMTDQSMQDSEWTQQKYCSC